MTTLVRYHWPGNIRELQNVIERAVILSTGPVLKVPTDELHFRESSAKGESGRTDAPSMSNHGDGNLRATLDNAERQEIVTTLEKTNGKVAGPNGAAALLGMRRSTLQSRMQKLGIRVSRTTN
jgi:formate hydrogenlyase transcriptional activator